MSELFKTEEPCVEKYTMKSPLADRMRPRKLDDVVGQEHLLAEGSPLRIFFEQKNFPSIIFWGPPGSGKTTLAYLAAEISDYHFEKLSAVESGVKEVREVIERATKLRKSGKKVLLFIDEIHRFNKSQQDALLHAVEKGIITLFGATTENPSFEVNSALLSRCQVYHLQQLSEKDIRTMVERVMKEDEELKDKKIQIEDWKSFFALTGGDARVALNALETSVKMVGASYSPNRKIILTKEIIEKALQQRTALYDKKGESHYDTISAFIKSMRGSDPDAALFWLAKMLDAGEDPKFIVRRMVIFASEDIGNADAFALTLAVSVFEAVDVIGMPECRINLAQGVTYLASAPKSNASYFGIEKAMKDIHDGADTTVPLHIRNAPTKLMKEEGYGENYKYPHSFPEHFVREKYFPDAVNPKAYYLPTEQGREKVIRERLEKFWKERYSNKK